MRFRRKYFRAACFTTAAILLISCLKDMPEEFPSSYVWNPEVALPLGVDSFGMNSESGFDTLLLNMDSLTGIPRWVDELEIVMQGSLHFDLGSLNETEEIDHMMFRINLYNGFPDQASVQAYFQDAGSNPLDSMFREGPVNVPAARVIGNGEETDPGFIRKDASFTQEELRPLEAATSILFRASFSNLEVDSLLIPHYPTYEIIADIGVMLGLNYEF